MVMMREREIGLAKRRKRKSRAASRRIGNFFTAAFLEDRLQELIQAFLIENEGSAKLFAGPNAPIGTFSSRIAAAYSLGLVTQGE
jgi:hypothetical protein